MILGETQSILARAREGDYDNFLFFGKKKKKPITPEQKQAKKEKRQQFWRDVAGEFKEGSTSKNLAELFAGGAAAPPSDYQVNVGEAGKEPPPKTPKKGIPTGVYVIGGVLVLGLTLYGVSRYRNNLKLKAKKL